MAVVFSCPKGHRLSCPEERAGKIGKCPKCGSSFVVPSPEVAATISAANLSGVGIAGADGPSVPAGQAAPPAGQAAGQAVTAGAAETAPPPAGPPVAAPPGDVIVFLCPNGHKLNCPPSLQGKAGKCPHCGARFVIPAHDDPSHEEEYLSQDEALEGNELDDVDEDHDSELYEDEEHPDDAFDDVDALAAGTADLPADFMERLTGAGAPAAVAVASAPAGSPPPLLEAFEELWQYRARGLVVQLHLRSGVVLSPDRYSFRASNDRYAIFAFKEPDGLYSVGAVAWAEVERLSVQGLKFLPDELFQ